MKELFFSECRRFRTLALIAAAVHLVFLQLGARMADPLHARWQVQVVFLVISALAGLALAVVQFAGYRQPSRWLWLMHRPLPRSRIFAALSLASAALLVFVIALPALLVVLGIDHYTGRTVDARHYLAPLHLLLAASSAWLAGCYLMLCGRRSAFVVMFVPALLASHRAAGGAMLLSALVGIVLMAALAYSAFKPDRSAPPASATGKAVCAIPLVLGFYCLMLWGGSAAFQFGQMLFGVNPLNSLAPPAGGYTELVRSDGASNLRRALASSSDPRAAHWGRQMALLEVGRVLPEGDEHPVRGAIANLDRTQWPDGQRRTFWTFNQDRMLFEGRDMFSNAPAGWYGQGGSGDLRPFDSVPLLPGKFIMTRQQLFLPEPGSGCLQLVAAVRAPETLSGALQEVGRQPFLLTNQRLIAYRRAADPQAPLQVAYSVPLPGPFGDLARIDVARLLDGTLLSFDFGRHMVDGEVGSRQVVLFVDAAGRAQQVAARAIEHDFPLLFEHKAWWLSPVAQALADLPGRLLDQGLIADAAGAPSPARPPLVLAAGVVAALLSAALAAWRLRGQPLRRRLAWSAAALVLGPPCVATLWLLETRPAPRPAASAAQAPSLPAAA